MNELHDPRHGSLTVLQSLSLFLAKTALLLGLLLLTCGINPTECSPLTLFGGFVGTGALLFAGEAIFDG